VEGLQWRRRCSIRPHSGSRSAACRGTSRRGAARSQPANAVAKTSQCLSIRPLISKYFAAQSKESWKTKKRRIAWPLRSRGCTSSLRPYRLGRRHPAPRRPSRLHWCAIHDSRSRECWRYGRATSKKEACEECDGDPSHFVLLLLIILLPPFYSLFLFICSAFVRDDNHCLQLATCTQDAPICLSVIGCCGCIE